MARGEVKVKKNIVVRTARKVKEELKKRSGALHKDLQGRREAARERKKAAKDPMINLFASLGIKPEDARLVWKLRDKKSGEVVARSAFTPDMMLKYEPVGLEVPDEVMEMLREKGLLPNREK